MKMVVAIAQKYKHFHNYEDLISQGYLKLVECSKRFKPELGNEFSTYAFRRVSGHMMDYLKSQYKHRYGREELAEKTMQHVATLPKPAVGLRFHGSYEDLKVVVSVEVEGYTIKEKFPQFSRSWAARYYKRVLQRVREQCTPL